MNNKKLEKIIEEKIKEEMAVLASGGVTLTALVRRYIDSWDEDVLAICALTGRNYYDFLVDSLRQSGREVDKQTLITTINRVRKSKAGVK